MRCQRKKKGSNLNTQPHGNEVIDDRRNVPGNRWPHWGAGPPRTPREAPRRPFGSSTWTQIIFRRERMQRTFHPEELANAILNSPHRNATSYHINTTAQKQDRPQMQGLARCRKPPSPVCTCKPSKFNGGCCPVPGFTVKTRHTKPSRRAVS